MMLEELQRRNYSKTTVNAYLHMVESFANHFHRPPDQLGPEEIRAYQVYLFAEKKLGARTVGHHTAALRFFFCKTLKRNYPIEEVPYPRASRRLPIILTQEEAVRLIDSASNLFHRAMLMTLYSTGMRRAELCHLKVEDIDSDRMIIHIRFRRNTTVAPASALCVCLAGAFRKKSAAFRQPTRAKSQILDLVESSNRSTSTRGRAQARRPQIGNRY
jgi:site-specific recombinase XerD